MDSVRKETLVASVMQLHLATDARLRDEEDSRPLPHQIRRPRQMGKNPPKVQATEVKAHGKEGADSVAEIIIVITGLVIICILPCVKTYKSETGCHLRQEMPF